jgi:hypothetical protein
VQPVLVVSAMMAIAAITIRFILSLLPKKPVKRAIGNVLVPQVTSSTYEQTVQSTL